MPTVGEATKSTKQTPPPTRPKRRHDTPPQTSTSQGAAASETPAEKTFFGFHPLRSLRNIFFGYRRRERPSVGAAAGPKAKSTDDLETTRQGNASLPKQQARKSCPFNKQMSLSADNLIDPDQLTMAWHPAPPDSYPPTTTAVAITTGTAATTAHSANDKKIGIISEEEDWTAEFFTEKWTIESRERVLSSSDGMRGSTDDLDAIGSSCHNLDVSVARNKLAVKQKGKRMSTAFLQKGHPANTRDALGSVAESEHEEKEKEETGSQPVSRANSSAKPSVACRDGDLHSSDGDLHSSDAVQSSPVAPIRVKRASTKSKAAEIGPSSESPIVDSTQVTASEVAPSTCAESTKEADSSSISITASIAASIVAPAIDAAVLVDSADADLASPGQAITLAVSSIPAVLAAVCPSKSSTEASGRRSFPGAPYCRKSAMETSGSLSAVETSAPPGDAAKPPREASASGGGEQGTSSPSCRRSLMDLATTAAKQPQDPNAVLHDDAATFEENQRIYARLKKQEFSPVVKGKHRKKSPDGEGAAGGKRPAS